MFRQWEEEVRADPSLAEQQPYKALVERDQAFFAGVATQEPAVVSTLVKAFARSWAGTAPEEIERGPEGLLMVRSRMLSRVVAS